jgi:hypothetical protein
MMEWQFASQGEMIFFGIFQDLLRKSAERFFDHIIKSSSWYRMKLSVFVMGSRH